MFAYCGNNPVSREDTGGEFWHLVIGGVIGGIIGGISAAVSGGDVTDILIGTAAGAAGGVLAATGAGVVAQALGSAAISMTSNAVGQAKKWSLANKMSLILEICSSMVQLDLRVVHGVEMALAMETPVA